ncbi:MAG: hypothetical protein JWQ71_2399, partial [Pedosphaera sp.]|nr:hypothetical protein [Pedosphaera sp.]
TLLDRNPAVIEIIRQLEVGSKSSRIAAYICLCSLMPDKEVAFPPLNRLVNGSDPDLAAMAAAIIKQLYPEDAEKAGINQRFPESMFSESDRPSTNAPVAK